MKILPLSDVQIAEFYLSGESTNTLAKICGVCQQTIANRLYKMNISLRSMKESAAIPRFRERLRICATGRPAWNIGLTKESDPRVASYARSLEGREVSSYTRSLIAEQRSKGRIFFDVCQKCGNKKGHSTRPLCLHCGAMKAQKVPTKPELRVINILNFMFGSLSPYVYSGCGENRYWIKLSNGKYRNPDFVSIFHKKVIEVFGVYWHRNDKEEDIINEYKKSGWDCIIFWENDFGGARDRIMEFTYPYEFEAELME